MRVKPNLFLCYLFPAIIDFRAIIVDKIIRLICNRKLPAGNFFTDKI